MPYTVLDLVLHDINIYYDVFATLRIAFVLFFGYAAEKYILV
jgi:hypothetical protein